MATLIAVAVSGKVSFTFDSVEEYEEKYEANLPVEEYEIGFHDGSQEEAALFEVVDHRVEEFFEWVDEDTETLAKLSYYRDVMGERLWKDSFEDIVRKLEDICIREGNIESYAPELFFECMNVPDNLKPYIDTDAFARDLRAGGDCVEIEFADVTYTITNANSF